MNAILEKNPVLNESVLIEDLFHITESAYQQLSPFHSTPLYQELIHQVRVFINASRFGDNHQDAFFL